MRRGAERSSGAAGSREKRRNSRGEGSVRSGDRGNYDTPSGTPNGPDILTVTPESAAGKARLLVVV